MCGSKAFKKIAERAKVERVQISYSDCAGPRTDCTHLASSIKIASWRVLIESCAWVAISQDVFICLMLMFPHNKQLGLAERFHWTRWTGGGLIGSWLISAFRAKKTGAVRLDSVLVGDGTKPISDLIRRSKLKGYDVLVQKKSMKRNQ